MGLAAATTKLGQAGGGGREKVPGGSTTRALRVMLWTFEERNRKLNLTCHLRG